MTRQVLVFVPTVAYNRLVVAAAEVHVKPTGYVTKRVVNRFGATCKAMVTSKPAPMLPPSSRGKMMNLRVPEDIFQKVYSSAARQNVSLQDAFRKLISITCNIPMSELKPARLKSHRGPGKKWNMKCTCCGQEHIYNPITKKWDQTDGPIYDDVPEDD